MIQEHQILGKFGPGFGVMFWEVEYSPCPTCGWTFYDQSGLQLMYDEVACQVCHTVVPMRILHLIEEDRILFGSGSGEMLGLIHA